MEGNRYSRVARHAAPFLISFGFLLFLAWPTVSGLASRWLKFDESYSHGFLLLAVSLYLCIRKWHDEPPVPGFFGVWLIPFLFALLGYVIGGVLRVEALQDLMLIPLVLGALAILIGWDQGRRFILPIGVLMFAMPFWDYLSWTLQLITVAVNEVGLGLLGIEFTIDGVYVYLTGVGAFEVAHGCSGLRYLLVGQALAVLYGELNLNSVRSRIYLYVTAVFLALLANWVRVLIIIYMGHETNMQSSLIEDHDNFGWWVFAVTLVPLFLLGRRLESRELKGGNGFRQEAPNPPTKQRHWYVGPAVVAVASLLGWFALPDQVRADRQEPQAYELKLDGEEYGPLFSNGLEGWRPEIRNPDRVYQQTLFDRQQVAGGSSSMPKAFYASIHSYDFQRQGAEVIQYFNHNYDSEKWRPRDLFLIDGPGSRELKGITLEHRLDGRKVHIAYGYYVEGHWESDQLRAKLSQLAGLFNARTDASQVTFAVSCKDCDPIQSLQSLVRSELPDLVAAIDDYYQP